MIPCKFLPSLLLGLLASFSLPAQAATNEAPKAPAKAVSSLLGEWPAGTDPVTVGSRITQNFLARQVMVQKSTGHVIYPEVCAWYGGLGWARAAGDKELQAALIKRYEPFHTPAGEAMISPKDHVDFRVFGIVPLEIALQNGDAKARARGLSLADLQWAKPDAAGLSHECRFWIDDMFMVPALQVQAWRVTKDPKYLDRSALAMAAYLDRLQKENGLFVHAEDSPFYWGRGNGWFAAGMAELLSELPATHPKHARILAGFHRMMASLLATQDKDGLWRQLVDQPDSWLETSGSAMFTYAFVTGVKRGWLPAESYGPAARKAWLALVARIDKDANLTEICVGTNKAMKEVGPDLATQKAFYLARNRKAGDYHGQAPMLWTAAALLR